MWQRCYNVLIQNSSSTLWQLLQESVRWRLKVLAATLHSLWTLISGFSTFCIYRSLDEWILWQLCSNVVFDLTKLNIATSQCWALVGWRAIIYGSIYPILQSCNILKTRKCQWFFGKYTVARKMPLMPVPKRVSIEEIAGTKLRLLNYFMENANVRIGPFLL